MDTSKTRREQLEEYKSSKKRAPLTVLHAKQSLKPKSPRKLTSQDKVKPIIQQPLLTRTSPTPLVERRVESQDLVGENVILKIEVDSKELQISQLSELNDQLVDELKAVKDEMASYCLREQELIAGLDDHRKMSSSLADTLKEEKAKMAEKESLINELRLMVEKLKTEVANIYSTEYDENLESSLELKEQLEEALSCIETMEEEETRNDGRISTLESDLVALETRYTTLQILSDESKIENDTLYTGLEEALEENRQLHEMVSCLESKNEELESDVEALYEATSILESSLEECECDRDSKIEIIANLQVELLDSERKLVGREIELEQALEEALVENKELHEKPVADLNELVRALKVSELRNDVVTQKSSSLAVIFKTEKAALIAEKRCGRANIRELERIVEERVQLEAKLVAGLTEMGRMYNELKLQVASKNVSK